MSLIDALVQLRSAHLENAYRAVAINDRADAYLGLDLNQFPCLFVRAIDVAHVPPMQTARVRLRFDSPYTLTFPDGRKETGRFHVLSLISAQEDDVETFLRIGEAFLIRGEQGEPPASSLARYFRSLVRLFDTRPAPDLTLERQGLWGELFLMRSTRGYNHWGKHWHSVDTRIFDFSSLEKRVEVKTTTSQQRQHRFSHRQLFSTGQDKIAIVSIMLTPDDAGLSLRELVDECLHEVQGSEIVVKLEQSIRRAGMESRGERGPSFNAEAALQSTGWYWADDLPHFRAEEPQGVSETHYKVDLTGAPQIGVNQLSGWLDLWEEP